MRSKHRGNVWSNWTEISEIANAWKGRVSMGRMRIFINGNRSPKFIAGHCIFDELGLVPERERDLVASLRSSVSAKNGKFVSASIVGFSPFTEEIMARQHIDKRLALHLYHADENCELDDRSAWEAVSPALKCGIKSYKYYESESTRVKTTTKDIESFKSYDLNIRSTPGAETLVTLSAWNKCVVDEPPSLPVIAMSDRHGGSQSLTSISIFFPKSRLLETVAGLPRHPDLRKRAQADNSPYLEMERRGELILAGEFTTDPSPLIKHVAQRLKQYQCRVLGAAADLYRRGEVVQSMSDADCRWRMDWRRTGAGLSGHEDVRYFQKAVMNGGVVSAPSVLTVEAIKGSVVAYDSQRNPSIDKRRGSSRVDALSSAVLAVGLACRAAAKPKRKFQTASIPIQDLQPM